MSGATRYPVLPAFENLDQGDNPTCFMYAFALAFWTQMMCVYGPDYTPPLPDVLRTLNIVARKLFRSINVNSGLEQLADVLESKGVGFRVRGHFVAITLRTKCYLDLRLLTQTNVVGMPSLVVGYASEDDRRNKTSHCTCAWKKDGPGVMLTHNSYGQSQQVYKVRERIIDAENDPSILEYYFHTDLFLQIRALYTKEMQPLPLPPLLPGCHLKYDEPRGMFRYYWNAPQQERHLSTALKRIRKPQPMKRKGRRKYA